MPKLLSRNRRSDATRDSSAAEGRSRRVQRRQSASRSAAKNEERIKRLLDCELSFVAGDSFRDPTTARRLRKFAEQLAKEAAPPAAGSHAARTATPAAYTFGITELLSPSEEREAFFCLNYLKWQANVLRATIDPEAADEKVMAQIEELHRLAQIVRDRIISANLRLVISIAKAQAGDRLRFNELFSEGVPVLLRAVEKFDVELGFRFSTYAYTAIRRTLHKAIADAQRHHRRQLTSVEPSALERAHDDSAETDRLPAAAVPLVHELLERLPPREKLIVQARFGLLPDRAEGTLGEVGKLVGVSKERTRQLLNRAFGRLRAMVGESRYADLLELSPAEDTKLSGEATA